MPAESALIKRAWFKTYETPPLIEGYKRIVQSWDIAVEAGIPEEVVGRLLNHASKTITGQRYHFFNDFDTAPAITEGIRLTYDGPLSLARDYMVWNIREDDIRMRMAIVDEEVWPPPATEKPQAPDTSTRIPYSNEIAGGKLDMKGVIQPIYDAINKQYGLKEKQN